MSEPQFTVALIKPDAMCQHNMGAILSVMEHEFVIGDMCHSTWTPYDLSQFYADLRDREFFPSFLEFMSSAPMLACTLVGPNAVNKWRRLIGATNPSLAAQGTLRHRYGNMNGPIMHNAVHGSDSYLSAQAEVSVIRRLFHNNFGAGAHAELRRLQDIAPKE